MGYLIGLDGGGTRTHVIVASEGAEIMGVGWAGPSNHIRVGEAVARENIAQAIQAALAQAEQDPHRIKLAAPWRLEVACVGFAGADRPQVRETLQRVLSDVLGTEAATLLVSDADIALAGAYGHGAGIVAMAGTGSIVLARDESGKTARCGGWGWLLGDEGGATHIGRGAIEHVLREVDGRAEPSGITPLLLAHFDLKSPEQIVWCIHNHESPPTAFSGFFPKVLEAAQEGDQAAIKLLTKAGQTLGEQAVAVVRHLAVPPQGWKVVYGGGVLVHSPWTLESFRKTVQGTLTHQIAALSGTPAEGALRLAADHFHERSVVQP